MNRLGMMVGVVAILAGCGNSSNGSASSGSGAGSGNASASGGSGNSSTTSGGGSTGSGDLSSGAGTTGNGSGVQTQNPGTTQGDTDAGSGTTSGSSGADDMDATLSEGGLQAGDGSGGGVVGASDGGLASCSSLPPVSDYSAMGPFTDVKMFTSVGPSSNYTLFRPDTSLGQNGFKHPVATWGNGILTNPSMYQKTLPLIASHGFVIIACNDTKAEEACLSAGMDWLIQQNTTSGSPMEGKLDTTNEVTIGYSWGGGAAIDTAVRPNVKVTASLHGMPPRGTDTWTKMHAPLLLTTSTGDDFVTASGYVTPNYNDSMVQTFYGTLDDSTVGHLYVVDQGASICIGSVLGKTFGACGSDVQEHALTIAWLRLWACGDQGAKKYFYGDSCVLCQSPWQDPQRKNWK